MRFLLLIFPVVISTSCTMYEDLAYTKSGNYERTRLMKLGGSADQHSANGSSITTDDQRSFSDAMTAATTLAAGVAAVRVQKSQDAVKIGASNNATKVSTAKISADAAAAAQKTAAQEATTNAAINKGAPLGQVNVNPP